MMSKTSVFIVSGAVTVNMPPSEEQGERGGKGVGYIGV
jgi:hypothetical protein